MWAAEEARKQDEIRAQEARQKEEDARRAAEAKEIARAAQELQELQREMDEAEAQWHKLQNLKEKLERDTFMRHNKKGCVDYKQGPEPLSGGGSASARSSSHQRQAAPGELPRQPGAQ